MKSSKKEENNANDVILKYILQNAVQFSGKANPKAVLGLILKENPDLRKDVPSVVKEIESAVAEIEKLSLPQQQEKLQKIAPELAHPKKEILPEGPLKPLPNAQKGKVVLRIAPSPSGPLHIGHAYGVSLNYEYAKMYAGKLILRIEDTNPENIYPPAYELIERDVNWLTDNGVSQVVIQSSRLGIYYDHAEKLVQMGKAYACTCNSEQWREQKNKGFPCSCRTLSVKENQQRYEKMFSGGLAEGEVVLRLKTDLSDKNPAMRDFGLMRIVEYVHPQTGKEHRVWPLMVFAVAIDDHELGITHVLNGKDHTDNAEKERRIMDCFGWKHPEYKHWGRINFEGFILSTTETRKAIEHGEYNGWEDIRLPFLPALRRRGYQPGAFRRYAIEIGLSLADKTVSREEFWKSINAFNKDIIDKEVDRYFFVDNPVGIVIQGAPAKKVELDLHPDFPSRGKRIFAATKEVYIAESDFRRLGEGYLHRLMDYCNFEFKNNKFTYVPGTYEEYKNSEHKGNIIHWLPQQGNVGVEVVQEHNILAQGIGEDGMGELKVGQMVQLERRYFARVDAVTKDKVILWYLHR